MARILVVGNAGFIASHLCDTLIQAGNRVSGIDNLCGGFWRNIHPEVNFYKVDARDKDAVDEVFRREKPEIVFATSADATEGRSQFTPVSATGNNVQASVNVFTSAARHGVNRVIFTSSMSVYGKQQPPFSEEMLTLPVDIYGVNKAASEKILQVLAGVHGFEYIIIRPHNVFGERQNIRDAYRNVVGIFMNRIMAGKPPIIYGDGEQVRSFTYIANIIPPLIECITTPYSNAIYNIGPTETQTINYLAETVLKAFNSPLKPEYVLDRPLEVKHAFCTVDKAIEKLGYKTLVSFEEGIKRMATWAKTLGAVPMKYLDSLELNTKKVPVTWRERIM